MDAEADLRNRAEEGPIGPIRTGIGRIAALFVLSVAYVAILSNLVGLLAPHAGYRVSHALFDLALLLVILLPCALLACWRPRISAVLGGAVTAIWLTAYTLEIQFLVKTGVFASGALVRYASMHLADVSDVVLSSGFDWVLVGKFVLAALLLCVALGSRVLHATLTRGAGAIVIVVLTGTVAAGAYLLPSDRAAAAALLWAAPQEYDLPLIEPDSARAYAAPTLSVTAPEYRPNIVFWIIESGRADIVDPSRPDARPPVLNRLAREALTFSRAYTTTSHTSKALIGILCGHYPKPNMAIVEAGDGGVGKRCLPELLQQVGYKTHFLQSAIGTFENRFGLTANLKFDYVTVQEDLDQSFQTAGYLAMDERALLGPLELAAQEASRAPSLIVMLTSMTHHPYALPGQRHPVEAPPLAYTNVVEYVDAFLGEAYQLMGKHLDWDETILIVVGDHGESFGEHGVLQHDSVPFEEVTRTPLFIRFPNRLPARADNELRQATDLLPTVLELLGLDWTGTIAGRSLLRTEGHASVVTTCWPTRSCHAVINADGSKVIFHFGPLPEMVFDLNRDPLETNDLSMIPQAQPLLRQGLRRIAIERNFAESAP